MCRFFLSRALTLGKAGDTLRKERVTLSRCLIREVTVKRHLFYLKKKKLSVDLFLAVLGVTFSTLDPQSQLWHVNSVAAGMWDLVP